MEERKGNSLVIIISIASLLIISIVSVYLFFFNSGTKKEDESGLPLYKYEVYNGEFKYYTDKIDANKIGLVDTLYYPCKNNTCEYVNSLYAGGNINKSKAVIKDGKTYLVYDFNKKETIELSSEDEYKYVDFVNDNYLLINNDNKYYSYNLSEKTLSSEIVTDLLITNLDNKPYVVWDNNIITYENNKYGIVSLSTGNSVYENDYEMINCYGNYCLLTKDELSNLYAYEKNDTDAVIKDIEVVKYFNDKYLAYLDNNSLVIYDLKTKESSKIDNFKKTNNIYSIDIKDKVITIKYTRENEYKIIEEVRDVEVTTKALEETNKKMISNVFITTKAQTNLTISHAKEAYDLKVLNNGIIYDNTGILYDNVSINDNEYEIPKDIKGKLVDNKDAYSFLNKLGDDLKLNDKEKLFFINKWMPILISNGTSIVNVTINDKKAVYDNINVITESDSFLYIKVIIKKVDSTSKTVSSEIEIPEINRKDNNIIILSGFSY